jgi:hypothetical protein
MLLVDMGGGCGIQGAWGTETQAGVKPVVGEKRGDAGGAGDGIVGREFGKREPFNPV